MDVADLVHARSGPVIGGDTMVPKAVIRAIHAALLLLAVMVYAQPMSAQSNITPDEARAIAKEAYIYGYPMVDN